MKSTKTTKRPTRTKNTIGNNTRVWVQLPFNTVTVATGHPTMDNKNAIPETWEVGHLPVYFGMGNGASIALTDLTEEELNQFEQAVNLAIQAARPVCKILDDRAFRIMNDGVDLDEVPRRVLRGAAPQLIRKVDTVLRQDPYENNGYEPTDYEPRGEILA